MWCPIQQTGLQPYQLMFGCKTQTPCDNWLDLNNYDSDGSVSKTSWLQEHHRLNLDHKSACIEEQGRKGGKRTVVVKQLCKPNVYRITDNCKTFKTPMIIVITLVMKSWAIYSPSTIKLSWKTPHTHRYATQTKGWPSTLVQSTIAGMETDHSDRLSSHTQHVDLCEADVIIDSTSLQECPDGSWKTEFLWAWI